MPISTAIGRVVRMQMLAAVVIAFMAVGGTTGIAVAQDLGILGSSDEAIVGTREPLPENTPGPLARRIADSAGPRCSPISG